MLSDFDKELLNLIQRNLPLEERPFAVIAELLNTTEDEVITHLQQLRDAGLIRRIGPFFDSHKLDYKGTLVALEVEPTMVPTVAAKINSFNGITHNYERDNRYNLWFTLLTNSPEQCEYILSEIRSLEGVKDMLNLVSNKKYKINVQFKLK